MEQSGETYFCSFVGEDYIICECGDSFSTEELLKKHLDAKHDTTKKTPEVPLKTVEIKPIVVYSQDKRQIYVVQDEIKQEIEDDDEDRETDDSVVLLQLPSLEGDLKEEEYEYEFSEVEGSPENIEYGLPEVDDEQGVEYEEIQYENEVEVASPVQVFVREPVEAHDHDYAGDRPKVVTIVQNDDEVYCTRCGKQLANEAALRRHMQQVHDKPAKPRTPKEDCPLCRLNAVAKICSCRAPRRPAPSKPRHQPKNSVCDVCGNNYSSNAALRYHMRVHTGEKPYKCTLCPKAFTMRLFLQVHMRTHTGERPYGCFCGKAFGNRAALQRHKRVHTGEKPYACPECGRAFTQSNSLKLHVRTVHLRLPAPYKSAKRRRNSPPPQPFPGLLPIPYKQLSQERIRQLSGQVQSQFRVQKRVKEKLEPDPEQYGVTSPGSPVRHQFITDE